MMRQKLAFLILVSQILFVLGTVNICWNYDKNSQVRLQSNDLKLSDDPFVIPHTRVNFTHPAMSVDADFDNLTIGNIFDMDIKYLTHGALLNFTFPNITLRGEYDMLGDIGDLFDIYGKGSFGMDLANWSVAVFPELYVNATSLCVPMRVEVFLQKINVNFTNFMQDEEIGDLMNKGFSVLVPDFVQRFWDDIRKGNDPIIEKYINHLINGDPTTKRFVEEEIARKTPIEI